MTDEELERKAKYDDVLQQYVHMIELGESADEDDSTYINRIAESIVSLGVALVDFEKPEEATNNFIDFMMFQLHLTIKEVIHQAYQDNPSGNTSLGSFNTKDLKKWRKDNGIS